MTFSHIFLKQVELLAQSWMNLTSIILQKKGLDSSRIEHLQQHISILLSLLFILDQTLKLTAMIKPGKGAQLRWNMQLKSC